MGELSADIKSAIIDNIMKFIASGGFVTTALIAPNAAQIFEKPLANYLKKLDARSRERELRRIAHYMKQKGLISYKTRDYEHGIQLTKEGKRRLKNSSFASLQIPMPKKWDKKWRLVFFDIPVEQNSERKSLTAKLRGLGFKQLQRSIWIHPFPCRPEIEVIGETLNIRKFLTYIEIIEIDNHNQLVKRFKPTLNKLS